MTTLHTVFVLPGTAEDAARLYTSLIDDSEIVLIGPRQGGDGPYPGVPVVVEVSLAGHTVMLLNGPGPEQSGASGIQVYVRTQEEVDRLWDGLVADGGRENQAGWLFDKFGIAWNLVPYALMDTMNGGDMAASMRVAQVFMATAKPDIAALEAAAKGA